MPTDRTKSYGQDYRLTLPDRFGHWLSERQLASIVPSWRGLRVGDFGCGFNAEFVRGHLSEVEHATLVDLALAAPLKQQPNVTAIEGILPDSLRPLVSSSFDLIICNNILEHLTDPGLALREFRRLVKPGGTCFFSVPSWRGKFFLELAAFRLGVTSAVEIDDHKNYFEKPDLWRLIVGSGWKPSEVTCRKHKFGLNTLAICRTSRHSGQPPL